MTYRELLSYINEMPERFLDTEIEIYDCDSGVTYRDTEFANDADETDYLIDADQPQIWINTHEVEELD